jgi:hypothetical protein
MPKRFTDTDKWKKPFLRGLQGAYKLLWFYICDDCDHAGIWQVDIEIAQIKIGEKITEKKAIELFGNKIQIFDNGTKWFIPSFIDFQYPSGLNPANKAHASVLNILKNKGLVWGLQGAKDTAMDKDMDKGGVAGEKNSGEVIFDIEDFLQKNKEDFDLICMAAHKKENEVLPVLKKYHLWNQENDKYPRKPLQLIAGLKKWLLDEKNFKNGTHQRNTSGNSKSAGANELADQLASKLAARGNANIES